ncbi:major capsid protein, partial [Pseudomonas sp. ZM24]
MKGMKQQIAQFNPIRSFRNLCIAGAVTAASAAPAFAIDTSAVESAIDTGKTNMETIGTAVVG